jgi:hypothetical protein
MGREKNTIVFSTLAGAPIALLDLSTPATHQRDCIFVLFPQITTATFNSREGQVLLPDRPTEYPCSYSKGKKATVIAFKNQNGWQFVVRIDSENAGTWSASKDAETLSGVAIAPFGD